MSATAADDAGRTFAYADPPYPGNSKRYYGDQPSYAGEVNHEDLIASLTAADYAGWARVSAWVKPIGVPSTTYGMHSTWEPVIVVGGRRRRPGVRDWLCAQPARGWGDLPGRKPVAFCAWLFDLLGMAPGDHLEDLFPGTGAVGRAWSELSSRTSATDHRLFQDVLPVSPRRSVQDGDAKEAVLWD